MRSLNAHTFAIPQLALLRDSGYAENPGSPANCRPHPAGRPHDNLLSKPSANVVTGGSSSYTGADIHIRAIQVSRYSHGRTAKAPRVMSCLCFAHFDIQSMLCRQSGRMWGARGPQIRYLRSCLSCDDRPPPQPSAAVSNGTSRQEHDMERHLNFSAPPPFCFTPGLPETAHPFVVYREAPDCTDGRGCRRISYPIRLSPRRGSAPFAPTDPIVRAPMVSSLLRSTSTACKNAGRALWTLGRTSLVLVTRTYNQANEHGRYSTGGPRPDPKFTRGSHTLVSRPRTTVVTDR
ncbi:hypothetical protein C8Q77DRAFT_100108 [Trametes polyzona]|nr:hypothetical protein C8Q77DRAFT_100108 [Trametes polyzona]